jgi:hypothetical protein
MLYEIIKTDKGYVTNVTEFNGRIIDCDFTRDGLLASRCNISDVWYNEKLKLAIEDYLESKNIPYEIHRLEYNISFYYKPERTDV